MGDATIRDLLPRLALERDSVLPLYQQLAQAIEAEIGSGALRAGQVLPSETAMCRDLGISRITIRQALDSLIDKKLIERRQGKGTYVAPPRLRSDLHGANGMYDMLFAQKNAPTSQLLAFGSEVAPADVTDAFAVAPGTRLVRLDRLYLLESRPVGMAFGWMAAETSAVTEEAAASQSTARLTEAALGQKIARSEMTIRAAVAGRMGARHLDLSPRSPVLVLTRRRFIGDGRVADFSRFYLDSDTYEFTIHDLLAFDSRPSLKLVAA